MRNITKVFLIFFAFFAELAFAFNEASAYFVYDWGKAFGAQIHGNKINLGASVLHQNRLFLNWNSADVKSDGGEFALFSLGIPFSSFEASFLFANGNWQKGDFDYFYGKPDIPRILGVSFSFSHGSNFLSASYITGNLKILNNSETTELFNSNFYAYNAFYKFGASENIDFSAGFAGLNLEASGALTAENQQYFLFPYLFYIADGYMNAKAVYGLANLYGIDFGIFYMLAGELKGNMHYKHRKFYGMDEVFDVLDPVKFKGSGIAFCVLNLRTEKIRLGKNHIQYGISKPLAMPFGKIFPSGDGKAKSGELLKDIFLWGLTATASVYF